MKYPSSKIKVKLKRLPHANGLPLPGYQSPGAAGLDLAAAVPDDQPMVIKPGERALIPTGLSIQMPNGVEAQVRPRSGLAARHGVTVLNTPGTIDADYRGEISVILINFGAEPFAIKRGDRIAQMIVAPVAQAQLIEVAELSETSRGAGGFGSTGVSAKRVGQRSKPRKSVAANAEKAPKQSQKSAPRKRR